MSAATSRPRIQQIFRLRIMPNMLRLFIFENFSRSKIESLDKGKPVTKFRVKLQPVRNAANDMLRSLSMKDITLGELQTCVNTVLYKTKPNINDWDSEPFVEMTKNQLNFLYINFKDSTDKISKAEQEFLQEEESDFGSIF